jgi:ribosomal protein S18 acetylase RimI-like enzyme
MRVVKAQPAEYVAALELLFERLPSEQAALRLRAAQKLLDEPTAELLIARVDGQLAGAALAQALPGGTGVLWPPRGRTPAVEDSLLRHALASLRRRGARLAQAILPRAETHLGEPLLRGGFTRPTQLRYLQRTPSPETLAGEFESYATADHAEFHQTLLRSYAGTRDFPELDGLRVLDEVIRGYQAVGYEPGRWWLRRDGREAVGVVMLSEAEPGRVWELTYIGVVPEARRRGLGRDLVRKALAEAFAAGVEDLTVCVDGRNTPALRLYAAMGFEEFDRRDVFLNVGCVCSEAGE